MDNLTLDQLRMALAVLDENGFSSASRRVGRVQSAVSRGVSLLEEVLEVELFDRGQRPPAPTDDGQIVLRQIRRVLDEVDRLYAVAAEVRAGVEPEVSLVFDPVLPLACVSSAFLGFQQRFPLTRLTVTTESLGGVAERVRTGGADVGISGPVGRFDDLVSVHVGEVLLRPVASSRHPLAREPGPLTEATLRGHTQIVVTDRTGASTRDDHAVVSESTWRVGDWTTKMGLLEDGLGWGNAPEHLVTPAAGAGRLVLLDVAAWGPERWRLPLAVVSDPARPPGPAARWLLDEVRAALQSTAGSPPASPGR